MKALKKKGAFYCLQLRLVPIFPFFLINLLMGLTNISRCDILLGQPVGMLAGTFVFS